MKLGILFLALALTAGAQDIDCLNAAGRAISTDFEQRWNTLARKMNQGILPTADARRLSALLVGPMLCSGWPGGSGVDGESLDSRAWSSDLRVRAGQRRRWWQFWKWRTNVEKR